MDENEPSRRIGLNAEPPRALRNAEKKGANLQCCELHFSANLCDLCDSALIESACGASV